MEHIGSPCFAWLNRHISTTGWYPMKENAKVRPFPKPKKDLLDKLIEKGNVDEMGLLDLVFIEEILKQKKQAGVAGQAGAV